MTHPPQTPASRTTTPPAFVPPLRLRTDGGLTTVATLDEALRFAETTPLRKADYDGMIRRLQAAREAEDLTEAANAFRWWAEANGVLADPSGAS